MAPTEEMSAPTRSALAVVRRSIPQRDFIAACDALRDAREKARERGDREEEIFLTSMLAPHLSVSGDDDAALKEILYAASAAPSEISIQLQLIRQLLRMKRNGDAAERCRDLLSAGLAEASSAHEVSAALGECLLDADAEAAKRQLATALQIAKEAKLDPGQWNRWLAVRLARRGERSGIEYLEAQLAAARTINDQITAGEIEQLLRDIGSGGSLPLG